MITSIWRFGWAALFAVLALTWGSPSRAQEKTPFPTLSGKHVYVSGVPDRYQALEAKINQLERSSPQTYYVVVVKNSGQGRTAATAYAEELFDFWREPGRQEPPELRRRSLDPRRSGR